MRKLVLTLGLALIIFTLSSPVRASVLEVPEVDEGILDQKIETEDVVSFPLIFPPEVLQHQRININTTPKEVFPKSEGNHIYIFNGHIR